MAWMAVAGGGTVERWGLFEAALKSSKPYANPFTDVDLTARFECDGETIVVKGFHDGDGTWRIRCMPTKEGRWTFRTQSTDPELDGKTGEFACGPPARGNHGPVRVARTWHFAYADGTPYFQIGTTCYAWIHQTEALQAQTLRTLARSPFNKIRFCIFPKSYTYNQNDPPFYPFERRPDGTFDFTRPNPVYWRHLERCLLDLQRLGIEADLILWHPYDRWGFAQMGAANDDRYLRTCIARLAAFRNVWWSLANEYDLMASEPQNHRGGKTMADWDRFFQILQSEDPFGHLRSIHNCRGFYDHTKPWVTHASIQSSDLASGPAWREKYRKPIVYDECRYEGNIPEGWGNLTAEQMVDRFWLGTVGGCYVGHGETYKHPEDILWWSKGGVLHGASPKRIQWLKDFMAHAPAFHELKPLSDGKETFVLAKEGEYYLVYCLHQRPQGVRLTGTRPYKVDLIDPWEMTVTPAGTASPGQYSFSAPKPDLVYRFTPHQPGEEALPEAKPNSATRPGTSAIRPRVIISSDFPPVDVIPVGAGSGPADKRSDPDDVQSMVRFLLYTNDLDVEGLVASAGTLANIAKKQNILDILNVYDQVDENLRRHDPRYPTADRLRSVTWEGRSNAWGKPANDILGEGKDSEASNAIIGVVDRPDPRPVWVCVWGGSREVAQAVWTVRATRTPADLERFLGKLRIYLIGKQDGSAQWLLDSFPSLFVILSTGITWGCSGTCVALIRSLRTWRGSTPTFAKDTDRWALCTRRAGSARRTRGSRRGIRLRSCTWSARRAD